VARRERRLRASQRARLALEILGTYVTVRRVMRGRSLPDTVAVLRLGAGDGAAGDHASLALANHLAWATVRTITLLPGDSRCLVRSLVLTRVLARRGLGSTLVLAAPPPRPGFEAHAWVEHAGEPVLLPGGPEHQTLVRL
jgi:Transglutaminase-like superfamily